MSNDPLSIAVVSLDIAYSDKQANLDAASRAIRSLHDVQLAVLPELFTTAFISDEAATRALAETDSGQTVKTMLALSAETGIAICGSFIATDTDRKNIYNRCFFITPDGGLTTYDKRHLFILGQEADIYTAGTELPPVVEYEGWRIAMAVCYDLRFPCWLRNSVVDSKPRYDVMLLPANWPDVRAYAWHHLLIARAIENQAYFVGANRSGEDLHGTYQDLSEIVDFKGKPVATANLSCHSGNIVTAELFLSKLNAYREIFPAWRSSD